MTLSSNISRAVAASVLAARPLEEIPYADTDGDGTGVWHEDAETRSLLRPMTPDELSDYRHQGVDRSLYRARQASLATLRGIYGDVWMVVAKRENRGRHFLDERKAVA